MAKSYAFTDAMKNNILRGSALKQKYERGEDCISLSLLNKSVNLEDVKQIYAALTKSKSTDFKKRLPDGGPETAVINKLCWGGSAGQAWTRRILREEQILKSYTKEILDSELEQEDSIAFENLSISKALNEEKRLATFVVLEPQNPDGTTSDLHLDWYDEETVEKSCHNFNRYCMKANLLHLMPTSAIEFIESYITKSEMIIGDRYIKKGTWLATIYVDESALGQKIWDGIKSGTYNGLSIQAMGTVEAIED